MFFFQFRTPNEGLTDWKRIMVETLVELKAQRTGWKSSGYCCINPTFGLKVIL